MSHDNLAAALLRQGRPADAKVHALAEIAIKPDVAVAYDKLAACLHMEGNDPQAIDAYRKATQLQSNDTNRMGRPGGSTHQSRRSRRRDRCLRSRCRGQTG